MSARRPLPNDPAQPVEALRNVGPVVAGWLREVGIETRSDLENAGAVLAYRAIKHRRPTANPLLLYALHGAEHDLDWRLPPEVKAHLLAEADGELLVTLERRSACPSR